MPFHQIDHLGTTISCTTNYNIFPTLIIYCIFETFQSVRTEFEGFSRLFSRFLDDMQHKNQSVDWEKIKLLPEGAVSNYILSIYNVQCTVELVTDDHALVPVILVVNRILQLLFKGTCEVQQIFLSGQVVSS